MADPNVKVTAEEQAARDEQAKREAAARQNAKSQDAPKKEEIGAAPHLVQNPVEANPSEVSAAAIEQVERVRIARENKEAEERASELPQKTIDEIEAGKAALQRHNVAAPQAVSDKA